MTENKPPQGDSHIIHLGWDSASGWDSQIASKAGINAGAEAGQLQVRGQHDGTWGAWRTVWDAANLPVNAAHLSGTSTNIQTQLNGKQNVAIVYDTGTISPAYLRIASIVSTGAYATYSTTFRVSNRRGSFDLYLKLSTAAIGVVSEENVISVGAGDSSVTPVWRIKRTTTAGSVKWDVYFYTREYAQEVEVFRANTYVSGPTVTYPGNSTTSDPGSDIIPKEVSNFSIDNWDVAYANTHTHSNKSYLDTINQSLATTATITANNFNASSLTASSIVVTNSSKNLSTMTNATSSKLFPYVSNNSVSLTAISTDDISIKSNGLGFAHPHDQWVNTTSSPTFRELTVSGAGTGARVKFTTIAPTTAEFLHVNDYISVNCNFIPSSDNSRLLGTNTNRWNSGYINNINALNTFSTEISGNYLIVASSYIAALTASTTRTQTLSFEDTYVIDTTATEIELSPSYSNNVIVALPSSATIVLPFATSPGFSLNINSPTVLRFKIKPSFGSYLYWTDVKTGITYNSTTTNLPYISKGMTSFNFCGSGTNRNWFLNGYATLNV